MNTFPELQGPAAPGPTGRQRRLARIRRCCGGRRSRGGRRRGGFTPVLAQLKPGEPGVETPFGRAPLCFADIIEKVKPSVVSISVVNGGGAKVASKEGGPGNKMPEGFPDIPEDSPFYEFFKNLPKEFKNMPAAAAADARRRARASSSRPTATW